MDKIALGAKLRELREKRALTREKVSHSSGISTKALERIEGGNNTSIDTLAAISKAINSPIAPIIEAAEHTPSSLLTASNILSGIDALPDPQKRLVFALALGDASYIEKLPELAHLLPLLKELLKLR